MPIAIELAAHPNAYGEPTPATPPTSGTVFSRSQLTTSKQGEIWLLAKLIFRSLDVGFHQLVSHFLRCHAAIEPFLIALRRCISTAHPVSSAAVPPTHAIQEHHDAAIAEDKSGMLRGQQQQLVSSATPHMCMVVFRRKGAVCSTEVCLNSCCVL